jgi:hypothetical protein
MYIHLFYSTRNRSFNHTSYTKNRILNAKAEVLQLMRAVLSIPEVLVEELQGAL